MSRVGFVAVRHVRLCVGAVVVMGVGLSVSAVVVRRSVVMVRM